LALIVLLFVVFSWLLLSPHVFTWHLSSVLVFTFTAKGGIAKNKWIIKLLFCLRAPQQTELIHSKTILKEGTKPCQGRHVMDPGLVVFPGP
jgi:hypothetical protein